MVSPRDISVVDGSLAASDFATISVAAAADDEIASTEEDNVDDAAGVAVVTLHVVVIFVGAAAEEGRISSARAARGQSTGRDRDVRDNGETSGIDRGCHAIAMGAATPASGGGDDGMMDDPTGSGMTDGGGCE